MDETIVERKSSNGLPFNYVNRFGVVMTETESVSRVSYKKELPFAVLAELHRIAKNKIDFEYMDSSAFETFIASAYSRDSSEAKQIVEDLGEELDLVSIAESVPENEDLLGREDDAPIIRLINAVLTEAIRENASDVHVETFEKELKILSISNKWCSTFLYFSFNQWACFKLKSCWDFICFIGIVNTIVFLPVLAHKVLTTDESIPPEIPTIKDLGL